MSPVDTLLWSVAESERYRLWKLREEGPRHFEFMFGERPHWSKCLRLAHRGSRGVRLRVVENGDRSQLCCLQWLAEFAVAVAEARGASPTPSAKKGAARRAKRRAATKRTTEAGTAGGQQ